METADREDLLKAKKLLENPGLAVKLTHWLGLPIEKGFAMLPADWNLKIGEITRAALTRAVRVAVLTMKKAPGEGASPLGHKLAAAATGGIGGFFGIPALAIELPVSTTIMLRAIADIARSEGEAVDTVDAKLACLEVFALGGTTGKDDAADSGYFAVRAALAQSVANAAEHIARKGLLEEGAPALVRLIVQIAQRFSVQVSEKAAAQAVPAIGAAGGAILNTIFIDHFQDMARGHFIVRRLERKYGREIVEEIYRSGEAATR